MKNTFLSLVVLIGLLPGTGFKSYSQSTPEKVPIFSVGADIKKGYYWRGLDLEHKGSFQPYLEATFNNFTFGAWSAFRITGGGSDEIDLYVSKEVGPVTITLFDYWSYRKDVPSCYFDFERESTSHLLECQVTLSGGEKIPINFLTSWLAWGSDPSGSIYLEPKIPIFCNHIQSSDSDVLTFPLKEYGIPRRSKTSRCAAVGVE